MKKFLLIIGLIPLLASAVDIKKEELLATDYFAMFDYQSKEKSAERFVFENKLNEQALWIEKFFQENPAYRAPHKKYSSHIKLAMNLVYAGMMLMNNNNGVIDGDLTYQELISVKKLSDKNNVRDEIIARYDLSARFLKLAMEVADNDDRISSWYYANLLRRQKYMSGKVDEQILDAITDKTTSSPTFHLFNALTMASDYDFGEEREDKILSVVEFMNSKESPCRQLFFRTGEAKKCNTTSKTPFAFQGTTLYMGDAYMKKAAKIYESAPQESIEFAKKAQAIYNRVDWFIFKPKAKKWKMIKHLDQRRELTTDLINGKNNTEGYFKTKPYLDIYTCMSCHQGGTNKSALHLRVPSN